MKKTFTICFILFLFFHLTHVFAQRPADYGQQPQRFEIKGKLLDKETGEGLAFATIRLFTQKDSTLVTGQTTDFEGAFVLKTQPGKYYLEASFVGYQTRTISDIEVTRNISSVEIPTITLAPDSELLQEVEVVSKKAEMEYTLDKRVYNVSENVNNLGSNASQILDNLPSVEVDVVEGTVSLRGSSNVRIMIDGKPSSLSGITSAEALRNLMGDMIEKVEIVTNPSARYEAEGEAGIINIVLKKNRKAGLNGSFDFRTGYPHNHGTAFNLNLRKKSVNFFASYGINYRDVPGYGKTYQEFKNPTDVYVTRIDRDHTRAEISHRLRGGMDFFITDQWTFTGAINYNTGDGDNVVNITYNDFDENDTQIGKIERVNEEQEIEDNFSYNFTLKKTFDRKDQELTMDFQWSDNQELELSDIVEQNLFLNTEEPLLQRSSNTEDQKNWLFQTNFIRPFGDKGKWETGMRSTHRLISNNFNVERDSAGVWVQESADLTENFEYVEDIHAGYFVVGNDTDKYSWQIGLRGEYTNIVTRLKITGEENTQEYFNLFPSVAFSYKMNKMESIQLSYTRRISRPRFRLLLPFSNFSDPRNFRQGNPNLTPEFTDSFEAGYLKNWAKGSILGSVYYRYRTSVIQRITMTDENNQNVSMPVNLSTQDAVGLELSLSYDFTDWWSMSSNTNFYREVTNGSFEGQDLSAVATTLNTRVNSKMDLPGDAKYMTKNGIYQ